MEESLLPAARARARQAGIRRPKVGPWAMGWVAGFTQRPRRPRNPYERSSRRDLTSAWWNGLLAGQEERARRLKALARDARQLLADLP